MSKKLVAWMVNDKLYKDIFEAEHYSTFTKKPIIPLYTHPAKILTDEEIWEVINRTAWVGTEEEIRFKIAEAILRKAQEG
jgi:hypothetical protein